MLKNARSYPIKFLDYLDKNQHASFSFYLLLQGLFLLIMLTKKLTPPYSDLFYVFGVTMTVAGLIFGLGVILREKYRIKISNEKVNFTIYVLLIIILLKKIIYIYDFNSVLFISAFIIIGYCFRAVLFSIFMFAGKANKLSEEDKKFNASFYSFFLIWFFLLGFSSFNFLFYKIFILFMVYGTYYLVKEKYLVESIKTPKENTFFINNIFSEVSKMSNLVLYLIFTIFLLFNYNVFTVSEIQPTLYYFYSTTAQVFAALLGIVVMFSIFILQKGDNFNDERRKFLKKGLKGFTILYTIVIIFSITGILVKDTINFNPIEKIPDEPDVNTFRDMLNVFIFESIILMVPAALLYLYGMISDFLYWEATIESKSGQAIAINPDTIKMVKGADRVKAEFKEQI